MQKMISIFSFFSGFYLRFYYYMHSFTHIGASSTVIDDVTN